MAFGRDVWPVARWKPTTNSSAGKNSINITHSMWLFVSQVDFCNKIIAVLLIKLSSYCWDLSNPFC